MKNKVSGLIVIISIVAFVSLAVFVVAILMTNPTKLGPGGVTFWFIDVLLMISSITTLSLYLARRNNAESKKRLLLSSARTGSILAFSLTLLLALSSLRSLNWRDIILLLLLVILVEVFFRTRREA
jgi:hypothetical protein